MMWTLTLLSIVAAAVPNPQSVWVAACYRRMDVVLTRCKPDSLDFRAYDNVTKQWTLHPNLNCFHGQGAETVPGPEPYPSGTSDPARPWIPKQPISLEACQQGCSSEPLCTGIVTGKYEPPPLLDQCIGVPTQCSEEICDLKPGQVQRLKPGKYYHDKQIFLPKGSAIIGSGINQTYIIACGPPTASGCNMTKRRGFLMGNDTYVGNFTFRGREDKRNGCPLGGAMIETPGCQGDYCGAPNNGGVLCNPPSRSLEQCTGVANATAEYIHLHAWTMNHVGWFPPTTPWGENDYAEISGSAMITLRSLTSWGLFADGVNFLGWHKYVRVEGCENSDTVDDIYPHWPQASFRPGFERKHDPRDCSDHLIFRNNIGRYPRFGTGPATICGKDCNSHTNPCFSLWGAGAHMAIMDNHCEEADGVVAMHPSYTNFKPNGNIQMWCGPIALEGNSYANPGYCSSQHCQAQSDDRICFRAGSWPTNGTIGQDPGCNGTALPSGFREKLWKGFASVAFPTKKKSEHEPQVTV